ncbi:translation initiation factor eIF3 core subunit j KNAG_0B02540 [Huiozyma naganishii CBS 8797]|uniref:Eukaryotic translation initiation factor 3 subunit J n=1 Tax=Huiozyma naganishii (strain ATCC MYA-139 / BCRC 22969 / CBS 8797 / KCTC 17520 / NBRC 10181 / NCYC 3082 / Yp74L-3) TaxID=1071383 RepID=J7S4N9_HUIN7|nr:hypothetical protein KNAG_0B02540 [Kazachstania naganishii CBS 8797]CCK68696.1 hypothetical protein KNAG_0B02540 [Kazachstania naganishii CBS 8797]
MSWEDDAINGSVGPAAIGDDDAVLMESWDADEPVLESWDAEPAAEEPKPAAKKKATTPATKKKGADPKKGKKEDVLLAIDTLDEKSRKELLKKAELESDLKNASDLFGDLAMNEHPRAAAAARENADSLLLGARATFTKDTPIETHPLFTQAETKRDFQDLQKALSVAVTSMNEKSSLNYSSGLAIDLCRDICKPMSIESIRQTVATLNVLIKDKERQERQERLARVRGGTATGGAGKKKAKAKTNLGGAFKKDQDFDMGDYDDFGDGDFM